MKSNKGVTLLELMVVVVIIGVLAGAAGLSISAIGAVSAKKAAAQLNSYLSTVRTKCMTRAGVPSAKICVKDGIIVGEYSEDGEDETDIISDKRVTVTYSYGDTKASLGENGLEISFARSTGALEKLKKLSISDQEIADGNSSISDPVDITITGGNNTYTVRIIPQTGNHEIIKGGEP